MRRIIAPTFAFAALTLAACVTINVYFPAAAAEKEEANARRQVASPTRSTEDGMRCFFVRGPFPVIARLDATVQWIADILASLGDADCLEERRVKALAVLANPHQAVALIEAFVQWRDRPDCPAEHADEATPRSGERPEVDWTEIKPTEIGEMLRKTLHLDFQVPGDEFYAGRDVILQKGKTWVMR